MSVSYDIFSNAFLSKVTEYDFIPMDPYERNTVIDGYMKRACAQFNRLCEYDLTDYDDVVREFNVDIPEEDIDEIADIVSEGMLAQWMRPYFYRAENLENRLSTSDLSTYSPAELLYRITEAYKTVKRDFSNMMKEYSYNHGDLTELWL